MPEAEQQQQDPSPADANTETRKPLPRNSSQNVAGSPEKPERETKARTMAAMKSHRKKPKRNARERINEPTRSGRTRQSEVQRLLEAADRPPAEPAEKPSPDGSGRMTNTSKRWPTGKQISASPNRSSVATLSGDKRRSSRYRSQSASLGGAPERFPQLDAGL